MPKYSVRLRISFPYDTTIEATDEHEAYVKAEAEAARVAKEFSTLATPHRGYVSRGGVKPV